MSFVSYEFIAFIAVLFVAYYLLPKKCQWPLLLIASVAFFLMADWRNMIYIGVTAGVTYGCALWMEKINRTQKQYLAEHKAELSKEEKKAICRAAMSQSVPMIFFFVGAMVLLLLLFYFFV